jgi:hypothetical protein
MDCNDFTETISYHNLFCESESDQFAFCLENHTIF